MPIPFDLVDRDKFAILAVTNIGTSVAAPERLADGTAVAPGIPGEVIDEFWRRSLGSIAVDALGRCNLVFVRKMASATPEILDAEHEELGLRLVEVFWLLQLSGIPYYEDAVILKGSVVQGVVNVRAHDNLGGHQFVASNGGTNSRVTMEGLRKAAEHAVVWRNMLASPQEFVRFKKGLNVLLEGLQEHFGQERLHAFVRALEALILPAIGKTKRQFVSRCETFALPSAALRGCLAESFDMRSGVEHMNDPDTSLSSYPVDQHEAIALRRVRQTESLARVAYSRLLSNPGLRERFRTDTEISTFWKLPPDERQGLWGDQLDLCSVACERPGT